MGHEHLHGFPGVPHGSHINHEHVHPSFEDADDLTGGDLGDSHHHWESLWIDIGGEG